MKQFELLIPNTKVRLYDRFALFILLINVICIAFVFYYFHPSTFQITAEIVSLLFAVICLSVYVGSKRKSRKEYLLLYTAISLSLYWFFTPFWWMGLVNLALYFFYSVARRKMIVAVAAEQITYPTFPPKLIHWNELDNIVLRDGLLTIDFKNNQIIQQSVTDYGIPLNEQDFNDFCHLHLPNGGAA